MAYPYKHTNRANRSEVLIYKGQISNHTSAGGVNQVTIDVPYGSFGVGYNIWVTSANADAVVKAYVWVDHAQTVKTGALKLFPYTATSAATLVTLAATTATVGDSGFLTYGSLGAGDYLGTHGYQFQITCNTSTGTIDYELVATQRS